jgi:hypothetical protein
MRHFFVNFHCISPAFLLLVLRSSRWDNDDHQLGLAPGLGFCRMHCKSSVAVHTRTIHWCLTVSSADARDAATPPSWQDVSAHPHTIGISLPTDVAGLPRRSDPNWPNDMAVAIPPRTSSMWYSGKDPRPHTYLPGPHIHSQRGRTLHPEGSLAFDASGGRTYSRVAARGVAEVGKAGTTSRSAHEGAKFSSGDCLTPRLLPGWIKPHWAPRDDGAPEAPRPHALQGRTKKSQLTPPCRVIRFGS